LEAGLKCRDWNYGYAYLSNKCAGLLYRKGWNQSVSFKALEAAWLVNAESWTNLSHCSCYACFDLVGIRFGKHTIRCKRGSGMVT